jgi:hypothetical protein
MDDGSVIHTKVTDASGSVSNPLNQEQEINKFLELAEPVLGLNKAQTVLDTITNMHQCARIPSI